MGKRGGRGHARRAAAGDLQVCRLDDRAGGARLFRPVLGAFTAASLDYDRRGEAYVEEVDEALLDADGAPPPR